MVSTKCPGDAAIKSDKVILIRKYPLVAKSHVHVSSLISNMEATAQTHSCPAGKTGMFFLQYKGVQYKKSSSLNNQIILSCRKKQNRKAYLSLGSILSSSYHRSVVMLKITNNLLLWSVMKSSHCISPHLRAVKQMSSHSHPLSGEKKTLCRYLECCC